MQLPTDITHKRGAESSLYTLMRRHHTTIMRYEELLANDKLAQDAKPVIEELLETNQSAHDEAGRLLQDFSGSPVKPNKDMNGTDDSVSSPNTVTEEKIVYNYLRDSEESIMHLYAELMKGDHFPEPVADFMTKQQQTVMDNFNRLDFKAKAR